MTNMSDEIHTFEKSLEQRLDEYMDILCSRGIKVSSCDVINEWKYYLAQVLEGSGWQALWKLSCGDCSEFGLQYPATVAVEVLNTDIDTLRATVDILEGLQDNTNIPRQIEIPLKNLHPTRKQSNDVLNVANTATCIDQLRFFYDHIWQPWDVDEDENMDWPSRHLESRLHLYYNMLSGKTDVGTQHVNELFEEGKSLHFEILALEGKEGDYKEFTPSDDVTFKLMKLHIRKEKIKSELQMLEHPVMQNSFFRERKQMNVGETSSTLESSQDVHFVWCGGSKNDFTESLTRAKLYVDPDKFIRISPLLQEILIHDVRRDIILCAGLHEVCDSSHLLGGTITGIFGSEKTIVRACNKGSALFHCPSKSVVNFKDITLNADLVETVLSIHQGTVRLENCHVVGKSLTSDGVVVRCGAKFEARNCCFKGLRTAVIIHNGAEAELTSCIVSQCSIGVKVFDNSKIALHMSNVSECKDFGIQLNSLLQNDDSSDEKIGSIMLLNGHPKVKLTNSAVENNVGGDVSVKKVAAVLTEPLMEALIATG